MNEARSTVGAAHEFGPDLILLDVIMSDMDGGDVAAALKKDRVLGRIPIVFVTAAVPKREAGDGELVSGGHVFLPKPVGLNDLLKAIQQGLSARGEVASGT